MTHGSLSRSAIFVLAAAPAMFFVQPSAQHEAPSLRMLNTRVDQERRVTIQIQISSGTKAIVMPVCDMPYDKEAPCWMVLQAATKQGWRAVQPKYAKLGAVPEEDWTPRTIVAGASQDLVYRFKRNEWEVSQGQRIRIVMAVWRDEQSMKKLEKRIELKTHSFPCP